MEGFYFGYVLCSKKDNHLYNSHISLQIWLPLIGLLLAACTNPDRHLVTMKDDQPVDLSRLDEVRRHLNGFWAPGDARDDFGEEKILWWSFDEDLKYGLQYHLPYNDKINRTETVPIHSCPINIEPILMNGQTYLALIGLGGSDTVQLNLLTPTRCIIGGHTYRRHKGYAFLQ